MPPAAGLIFDIRSFSVHDGPGIRTTVFFKGCPLDCWWCHNPESQSGQPEIMLWEQRCVRCGACLPACPQDAIEEEGQRIQTNPDRCTRCGTCIASCPADARQQIGRTMTNAEVMAHIARDVAFYDESGGGVTFSGGEPLMQPDFLFSLLQACREQEIHTVLDTSGYAAWDVIDRVRPYVNLFLYDLKLVDDERHRRYTGVSNRRIIDNLRRLAALGAHIYLRVPLIPGVNQSEADLNALGDLAAGLPGIERIDLLPYHHAAAGKYDRLHRADRLPDLLPPSAAAVESFADLLRGRGLTVRIGG